MFYEIEHICFPFASTRESIFIQFVMKRGICIYCHLLSRKLIYCDDFQQKNGMFRVKRNRLEELLTEHINIFYLRRVKSTYFPSKRPNMIFFLSFFLWRNGSIEYIFLVATSKHTTIRENGRNVFSFCCIVHICIG